MKIILAGFCALALTIGVAFAGPTMSIRLVEASNAAKGVGAGLGDVAQLLGENLPFNSFRLVAQQSLPLPANGSVSLADGIIARCNGTPRNLTVTIERGGKIQIQSTVELRKDTPLILGGLPSKNGKMIVILLMK